MSVSRTYPLPVRFDDKPLRKVNTDAWSQRPAVNPFGSRSGRRKKTHRRRTGSICGASFSKSGHSGTPNPFISAKTRRQNTMADGRVDPHWTRINLHRCGAGFQVYVVSSRKQRDRRLLSAAHKVHLPILFCFLAFLSFS